MVKKLNEGGNAISNAEPIQGDIAGKLAQHIIQVLKDGLKVNAASYGSTGKKPADQTSGDIDIGVEMPWSQIDKLKDFIKSKFGDLETNEMKGLKLLSVGFPYKQNGQRKIVQVDFMPTDDLKFSEFTHFSPNYINKESSFKGAHRTNLFRRIVGRTPLDPEKYGAEYFTDKDYDGSYKGQVKSFWKLALNSDEGLKLVHKTYEGKKKPLTNPATVMSDTKIITKDIDKILEICLGPKAKREDTNSFESFVDFICSKDKDGSYNYKYFSPALVQTIFSEYIRDEEKANYNSPERIEQLKKYIDSAYKRLMGSGESISFKKLK